MRPENDERRPPDRLAANNVNRLSPRRVAPASAARSAPRMMITIPLEGRVQLNVDAETGEDEERLADWLRGSPRVAGLIDHALALVRDDKRQCQCGRLPMLEEQVGGESGDTLVTFGRHAGKTIRDIYEADPGYVNWLMSESVKDQIVRRAARRFLEEQGRGA
jgi:hypothetical protein